MFFSLSPNLSRLAGIAIILFICFLFSNNKKKINFSQIMKILISMFLLGWGILKSSIGIKIIVSIAKSIESLYEAANVGINFLFGSLANPASSVGFIFAFKVLPIIVFFGSFMSVLYYLGIIQFFVEKIGFFVKKIFNTSGPETLCAIANSFLGQTEAPLLIKSYLKDMSKSEIFVVMVSGMSTISAGIMAVYGSLGVPVKHILVSSILSIPASILISKILVPETKKNFDDISAGRNSSHKSLLEAIFGGASEGMNLAFNVGSALLVTLTFIYLINNFLILFATIFGKMTGIFLNLKLENILSFIAYPITWILGIDSADCFFAANLIGTKIAINEMIAYTTMITLPISVNTIIILTYALCGFSNFSSIGIQIGGIGAMEPSIKNILSELGLKAVFAATLANLLSACVAGLFIF